MLSFVDNGHGMSHVDVVRMLSFGHKQPGRDDPDHIGRFGIGFKVYVLFFISFCHLLWFFLFLFLFCLFVCSLVDSYPVTFTDLQQLDILLNYYLVLYAFLD